MWQRRRGSSKASREDSDGRDTRSDICEKRDGRVEGKHEARCGQVHITYSDPRAFHR